MTWVDRTGRQLAVIGKPAMFMTPFRLSPDGQRIAGTVFEIEKGGMSVWLFDAGDGTGRKLTSERATEAMAVWSPDGRHLAFGRAAGATPKLYTRTVDDTAAAVPLTHAQFQLPTDWSRDGRFVFYQTTGGLGEPGADIAVVDLSVPGKTFALLHSEAQEIEAVLSPNSSTLAYISDETGRPELYVQAFSSDPEPHVTGPKHQVSRDGASVVRWRGDGNELFYVASDNWITATALDRNRRPARTQRLFRVGFPPRQLTAAGPAIGFDVTPDGERFIVPDTADLRPSPFIVIQNWTLLLRKTRR